MIDDLIYDVGFHIGQDTEFYLKKGFRVIGIDANPLLIEEGRVRFKKHIDAERLVLINIGIGWKNEILPFYVNNVTSEWSSFHHELGTTRGDYNLIKVPVVPLASIVREYGVPYYLKVDIEGYDISAIQSLREFKDKPRYVSVENGMVQDIEELFAQGYSKFKFINQAKIPDTVLCSPAKEGLEVEYKFRWGSSGPFGEETSGPWLTKEEVCEVSQKYWNNPGRDSNVEGWYDLRAKM